MDKKTNDTTTSTSSVDTNSQLQEWAKEKGDKRFMRQRGLTEVRDKDGNVVFDDDGNPKVREKAIENMERLDVEWNIFEQKVPEVVKAWIDFRDTEKAKPSRRGPKLKGFHEIADLDPTALAIVALSSMWQAAGAVGEDMTETLLKIGGRAEQQAFQEAFAASGVLNNTDRQKTIDKAYKRHDSVDQLLKTEEREQRQQTFFNRRQKSLEGLAREAGFDWTPWTDPVRVHVGAHLYNIVIQTGLFEGDPVTQKVGNKWHTTRHLVLSDEAEQARADGINDRRWQQPVHQVLTEKPVPWTAATIATRAAPYPDDEQMNSLVPLVRKAGSAQRARIKQALESGEMDLVLEALNALSDVEFVINQDVWDVITFIVDNYDALTERGVIQHLETFWPLRKMSMPPRIAANDNGDEAGGSNEAVIFNAIQRREAADHNRGVKSTAVTKGYVEDTVDMLKTSTFHCTYNLDFRGRINPIPVVNMYGANHEKALFYFANGKPIGKTGYAWLLIHTATVGDFTDAEGRRQSKVHPMDRIKWAEANIDWLLEMGGDPTGTIDQWCHADKEFEFIAACMELVKVQKHGLTFQSGLVVSIDGSCSGYQHLSAAMRSSREAALVNLIPSDAPQDIYQYIADKAIEAVKVDAANGNAQAKLWLDYGITRSVTKRSVMTAAYNSNAYGFTDQLMKDLMRKLLKRVLDPNDSLERHPFANGDDLNGFRSAQYLGRVLERQITANLNAAFEAMEFFKACARACIAKGKHFRMMSPLNFPFFQNYCDYRRVMVKPAMYSRGVWKQVQITLQADNDNDVDGVDTVVQPLNTAPVHRANSENAISANLTHMADACHMQMTIVAAKREGINNFLMIHDSFGVTPADMPLMFDIVRDMFIALYEEYDPFEAVLEATDAIVNYNDDGSRIPRYIMTPDDLCPQENPAYTVLPKPPEKGDLDIKQVADSWHCFI